MELSIYVGYVDGLWLMLMTIYKKLSTTNTIVIENLDNDYDITLENKMLKEENKRLKIEKDYDELREENKMLKLEKEHLKTGLSKFTRGQYL